MPDNTTRAASDQIFAAVETRGDGYFDRESGVIEMSADDLAAALLAAGWVPPDGSRNQGTTTSEIADG